jgi:PPOX class probable F420-dependent enzyme
MERVEAIRRLQAARVGRLATVRPDGSPHVVPFVFAIVEAGGELTVYWAVDAKPKTTQSIQRLTNLEANPAVEFVVDGYEEDWTKLWWVRAAGRARIVASDEERGAALVVLAEKYPPYRTTPPAGPVVAIEVDRVTGWSSDPPA